MKKCKKIVCAIVIACILAGAAFVALEFMGVIDLNSARKTEEKSETEQDGNKIADDETEPWHIVFKGYAFSVNPVGLAIIHESGCLNIRSCDDYLIQIDVEDKTMADFWDNREQRKKNIEDAGYVMELEPEKFEIQGKEYIRYIASLANERGAKFDRSYFYQLICDAGEGQRFFTSIRFDEIDIDALSGSERAEVYEKAADEAVAIVAGAVPTDETNDMTGSYWQADGYSGTFSSDVVKEEYTDAELVDSIANEDIYVSYEIPENFILLRDDQTGKSYYSEADKSQVIVSVIPYTWKSAADMAEDSNSAGISKVTAEGQYEEKGKIYYYYAYSILRIRNGTRKTSYYFNAYTDLEDGNIYSINGFADDSPEIMNPKTYTRFMSITEE